MSIGKKVLAITHDDESWYSDCPKCGAESTVNLHDSEWWGVWERDGVEVECYECKATFTASWSHTIDVSFSEKGKSMWDSFAEGSM